jgi:hypothetical protein
MDFLTKPFGKLTYKRSLERLHSNYKSCVAESIESYMKTGDLPSNEICVEEKKKYYLHLHDLNKVEHDSLMLFAAERIGNGYDYK